ncbi:MAG: alpha/beta fold hydrolase [Deltaproteobacteria bacterium]
MPYAKANGINIYYEAHGSGEPAVLIGGLGSQLSSWAAQMPIYSEYFRVLAFDNRGMGRSDKPDVPYTTELMADDAAALMDALGIDRAHVLGKSMGGMIAQWLAVKYPEKVRKLVLACTSASRDEVGNEILRQGREIASKAGSRAMWMVALFLGYSREYIEKNLSTIQQTMAMISEDPSAAHGYLRQSHACEGHNICHLVGGIKAKTLVMLADRDIIASPARSLELAKLIPGSTLKVFEGAGHGFWRERQEEVDRAVLDFLLG